ncbi:MAG TPA: PIG-L family deacetylase [Marmoricola sp.]|nr:PIG-L family deacetylase [Marmoricola sp.]
MGSSVRVASGPHTLVAFHAHPDDEALLTGGTLARAAAEGHRVVLVTATDGERGLAGPEDGHGARLAAVRVAELEQAAAALGVARLVRLGYGDSGLHADPADETAFANADVEAAAARLADLLRDEEADVLVVYDENGGYGHPDHVQVHRVGSRAAVIAGTPVVLEATVPADLYRGVLRVLRAAGHALGRSAPLGTERVFSPRSAVTHRVRFPRQAVAAKRAAMAAHGTQRRAEGQPRVLDLFLRLPGPVFALVFGREWFAQQGLRRAGPMAGDIFSGLPDRDK